MSRVRPPVLQLLARSLAPLLSTINIIGFLTVNPINSINRIENSMSCAQAVAATSSASVTDNIVQSCILLRIEIGAPFKKTAQPLTLFCSVGSFAKSESENPKIVNSNSLLPSHFSLGFNVNPCLNIAVKYAITRFIAFTWHIIIALICHVKSCTAFNTSGRNHFIM